MKKILMGMVMLVILLSVATVSATNQIIVNDIEGNIGLSGSPMPLATFDGKLYKFTYWTFLDINIHYSLFSVPMRMYFIDNDVYGCVLYGKEIPVSGEYQFSGDNEITINWMCNGYHGWAQGLLK